MSDPNDFLAGKVTIEITTEDGRKMTIKTWLGGLELLPKGWDRVPLLDLASPWHEPELIRRISCPRGFTLSGYIDLAANPPLKIEIPAPKESKVA